MEHLVESHLYGNYYISGADKEVIEAWCETCGDYDHIILSWEPENRFEKLYKFFTKYEYTQENLINDLFDGLSYEDLETDIEAYYENRIFILKGLYEDKAFSKSEYEIIKKQIELVKKEQLRRLNHINIPEIFSLRLRYKSRRLNNNESIYESC